MSLAAAFASLHAILYFVSFGLWRNWGIYLETVEGVILGPKIGFLAAFLGSLAARTVRPDANWMFGIVAEPFSVMIVGFLMKNKWKPVLAAYVLMLSAYFIHPFGQALPAWTILDVLLALLLIYPTAKLSSKLLRSEAKRLTPALALTSFIGVATDSLVRVFLLVPCGLYRLFFDSFSALNVVFTAAAIDSFIEDGIVIAVSIIVGVPVLTAISKLKSVGMKEDS